MSKKIVRIVSNQLSDLRLFAPGQPAISRVFNCLVFAMIAVLCLQVNSTQRAAADDPVASPDIGDVDASSSFGGGHLGKHLDFYRPKDDDERRRELRDLRDRLDKKDDDSNGPDPVTGQANDTNDLPDRNDKFDGSEFKTPTFIDTDFSQRMYSTLFDSDDSRDKDFDSPFKKHDMTDGSTDKKNLSKIERRKEMRERMDKDDFRRFIKAVYYVPGDWVPSGLDSIWNGGFTTPPDNGAPVPYRLDGHVKIQRGYPWDKGD